MGPTSLAVRSIATEFAYRIYKPLLIFLVIIFIVVIALIVWLLTVSAWWWLLAIPVISGIIIVAVLLVVSSIILRVLAPEQTKQQKKVVASFVDKIQRLSEITQTPKFVLLFQAIRSVVSPKEERMLQSVITDTSSLKKDYLEVVAAFTK